MHSLALLLHDGANGLEKDIPRTIKNVRRSHRGRGCGCPGLILGYLLPQGIAGLPLATKRAARLYERAIKKAGDLTATYNLALLLAKGADGVKKDLARAVELFEIATNGGMKRP